MCKNVNSYIVIRKKNIFFTYKYDTVIDFYRCRLLPQLNILIIYLITVLLSNIIISKWRN